MLMSRVAASARGPRRRSAPRGSAGVLSALMLCSAALLAGCQSNPAPPPLESTSTSPSPSPSPTVSAPTLPAEAQGTSRAAAKAFVRHWIDVLNYAGPAGDSDAIRRVSDRGCTACTAIADFIEQVNRDGGRIEGPGWAARQVNVVSVEPGKSATIDVVTWVNVQHVRPSAGADVQRFQGGRRLKTFWLAASDESWVLTRLDQPQ
jgi:hypothetical protein